jgi:DNA-binding LacI/PurR family transcriptional regulator
VLAVADQLGYRPSPAARSLITSPVGRLGQSAVALLMARLGDGDAGSRTIELPTQLIVRSTTSAPRSADRRAP